MQLSFNFYFTREASIQCLDACVDLVFLIDVIFNFRTTYLDPEQGEEIVDPYRIAKNYWSTSFWLDFLSSIPLEDLIVTNSTGFNRFLSLFGLLKLLRLKKLTEFIANLNSKAETKVALKILFCIFATVLIMHCLACGWYSIIKIEEKHCKANKA